MTSARERQARGGPTVDPEADSLEKLPGLSLKAITVCWLGWSLVPERLLVVFFSRCCHARGNGSPCARKAGIFWEYASVCAPREPLAETLVFFLLRLLALGCPTLGPCGCFQHFSIKLPDFHSRRHGAC